MPYLEGVAALLLAETAIPMRLRLGLLASGVAIFRKRDRPLHADLSKTRDLRKLPEEPNRAGTPKELICLVPLLSISRA